MRKAMNWFRRDEAGAVTTEFVVVTAGAIGIALAVMATLGDGILDTSDAVNTEMEGKVDIDYSTRAD